MEDSAVDNLGRELAGEELTFAVKLSGGLRAYLRQAD